MKKIFRYLMPCLALLACLVSCDDEMGAKADIDNAFASSEQPAVTLTAAQVTYTTVSLAGTVDDVENLLEVGFQISKTEDFASCETYTAAAVAQSFTAVTGALDENSTYYVRPYAVTRAAGTAVGTVQTFTTTELPVYALDGMYTVTEYEFNSDTEKWSKEDDTYPMLIEFVTGSTTDVEITNLWGMGGTVTGTYDAANQVVVIPTNQMIGVHPNYGNCFARGVNDDITDYTSTIVLRFTPKGGKIASSNFNVYCDAGSFGFYRVEMTHN